MNTASGATLPPKTTFIRRYDGAWPSILRALDSAAILISAVSAYFLRFGNWAIPDGYQLAVIASIVTCLAIFPLLLVYGSWRIRTLWAVSARVFGAWSAAFIIIMILMVLTKRSEYFSRLWLTCWFFMGGASLLLVRLTIYGTLRVFRSRHRNQRAIAIVGCGPLAAKLVARINESKWMGIRVAAIFNPEPCADFPDYPQHRLDELAAIAVGIKLTSPGPVLFKQKRHGLDGQPFTVYKFRTMELHREGATAHSNMTNGCRRPSACDGATMRDLTPPDS